MKVRIPEGKSRLMIVEGKEDQEFFIQLATHMNVIDSWPLHIEQLEGKGNFGQFLRGMMRHPRFGQLSKVGIVRDADYGGKTFQSIQDTLESVNERNRRQLPIPQQVLELAEGEPNIIALVLPSGETEGMIEDLIMKVFDGDPVTKCVDMYFKCLSEQNMEISKQRLPKARLRALIMGKSIDSQAEGEDSGRRYLSDVFHMSWWRDEYWDVPAFDQAKSFLTSSSRTSARAARS